MRLYLVVSELLREMVWEDWFNNAGHEEYYCIAELVLASKPSEAKYIAWKQDKVSLSHDITDMPRMSCRRKGDFPGETEARIVSDVPAFQFAWDKP